MIGKYYKSPDYESYIYVTSISEYSLIGFGFYKNSDGFSMIGDYALAISEDLIEINFQTFSENIIPVLENHGKILKKITLNFLLEHLELKVEPFINLMTSDQKDILYGNEINK